MFEVIIANTKAVLVNNIATAEEAKAIAKEYTIWQGCKCIMRKQVSEAWREREAKRLIDGTYKPLPDWWLTADWWCNSAPARDHYAHLASDGVRISFTESPNAGDADRQLVMSASRYLGRYFSFTLGAETIRDYAYLLEGQNQEHLVYKTSILPEDFERVFEGQDVGFDGSSCLSCMRYPREQFRKDFIHHPAYVYGAGDLIIAWLEDTSSDIFTVRARAVCNIATKTFVRIYSRTPADRAILSARLAAEGYCNGTDITPARLLRIEYIGRSVDGGNYYYMPYIDGRSNFSVLDEKYFILGSGNDFSACDTAGFVCVPEASICPDCGKSFYYGQTVGSKRVCNDCIQKHYLRDSVGNFVRREGIEKTHTKICLFYGRRGDNDYYWMPNMLVEDNTFVCGISGIRFCRHNADACSYYRDTDDKVIVERDVLIYSGMVDKVFYCKLTKCYYNAKKFKKMCINSFDFYVEDPQKYGYVGEIPNGRASRTSRKKEKQPQDIEKPVFQHIWNPIPIPGTDTSQEGFQIALEPVERPIRNQ